ncbi:excinuclease ABC subunit C [Pedobacter psychrophilus]|uniref:Excinuclease ABC subunit C n=1 Tax=Pedobacter psychrophilus TaxID=1826909 RepID=A0A179DN34_9SPHI|nr:GIY-YIG nuclease family protein [Pedobacter psychrophilus]OAQ42170.1 excinuclease ABC subunit C [Pedobacter psychrophilus]
MKSYYVYLLTNKNNTVIYTGFTNDLKRRIWEHKFDKGSKFTTKYNCNKLIYYEEFNTPYDGIAREKQLKGGSRAKKEALINLENSQWSDLSIDWY